MVCRNTYVLPIIFPWQKFLSCNIVPYLIILYLLLQNEKCDGAFGWLSRFPSVEHRFILWAPRFLQDYNNLSTWRLWTLSLNIRIIHVAGIGNPPGSMDVKAYLLQKFSTIERKQVLDCSRKPCKLQWSSFSNSMTIINIVAPYI